VPPKGMLCAPQRNALCPRKECPVPPKECSKE